MKPLARTLAAALILSCAPFVSSVSGQTGTPPPAAADTSSPPSECKTDTSSYKGKACSITINRDSPVTLNPITVPNGTTIKVVVTNARWNGLIAFGTKTSELAQQEILLALLKNFLPPLQSFIVSQKSSSSGQPGYTEKLTDEIDSAQTDVETILNGTEVSILNVNNQLECFEKYSSWFPSGNPTVVGRCQFTSALTRETLRQALALLKTSLAESSKASLAQTEMDRADSLIGKRKTDCAKSANPPIFTCDLGKFLSNQARYKTIIADMQKQQNVLYSDLVLMNSFSRVCGNGDSRDFSTSEP